MEKGSEIDAVVKSKVKSREDIKIKKPNLFKVILHNDDYTSMEFVVKILISVFNKPLSDATKIMHDIHNKGKGICGVYTYDIAITKVNQVHRLAEVSEFPLMCSYEEA
jgi:ATP-dependent Clp protease adaptor protein ClpS